MCSVTGRSAPLISARLSSAWRRSSGLCRVASGCCASTPGTVCANTGSPTPNVMAMARIDSACPRPVCIRTEAPASPPDVAGSDANLGCVMMMISSLFTGRLLHTRKILGITRAVGDVRARFGPCCNGVLPIPHRLTKRYSGTRPGPPKR
ncbi:hypothetical protein ebA6496 [Aromatoleum aromaticum EbN1]|uniref:Uncharacterized protein n=1 Tax=Aromatoleum aromaticum (strain DSM 19018 / LMG 30748 / EbN1) TaxID=76114 RepID=Q5NYM9_AROAE|nr:hypothetical protein ebA6496 [Aromatoleum aromaticum EbN1]